MFKIGSIITPRHETKLKNIDADYGYPADLTICAPSCNITVIGYAKAKGRLAYIVLYGDRIFRTFFDYFDQESDYYDQAGKENIDFELAIEP